MDVMKAIQSRREITSFKQEPIPEEVLETIVEAAYLSPSGNNLPSREFILVTNRERLDECSKSTPFVPWLTEAQAAIVVTGRPDVSKYWLQDASISSGYIWLSAVENQVGAAFGAIYHSEDEEESQKRESKVRKTLSIPNDRRIVAIVGLGYEAQQPKEKKLLPKEEIVHYETFKTSGD